MKKRTIGLSIAAAAVVVLFTTARRVTARPVPYLGYAQMTEEADLVVIAKADSAKTLNELGYLPYPPPKIPFVGVETTFTVVAVLKIDNPQDLPFFKSSVLKDRRMLKVRARHNLPTREQKFVLHHYRLENPKAVIANGPLFVNFDPKSKSQYLMFLRRTKDGRFEAVTGQTDPGLSIESLRDYAKD